MIERVHEHLISELSSNTRTDTIFILTAIILNLITLGINSILASAGGNGTGTIVFFVVLFMFVSLLIVVNLVAEVGLIRGRQMRRKLLNGLMKMYKDQGVEGYYDSSLLGDYGTRYNLFMLSVLFTGLIALVVPLIVFAL